MVHEGLNRLCGRSAFKNSNNAIIAHGPQGSVLDSEEGIRFRGKTVRFWPPGSKHASVETKVPARFRNARNYYPKPLVGRNHFPKVILPAMMVEPGSYADCYRSVLATSDW